MRTQAWLPLNPQHFGNLAPDLAWNTAISFMTNTNWQFYSGESTMSYLSQMAGLAWHKFVSAATGIAIAIALMRGSGAPRRVKTLGNFWVDLTRAVLYVLLPIAIVGALVLHLAGRAAELQRLHDGQDARGRRAVDPAARWPRRRSSKSSAPTAAASSTRTPRRRTRIRPPLTNLLELVCIFLIGGALTYTFGRFVQEPASRLGAVRGDVACSSSAGFAVAYWAEAAGNPIVHALGVAGGNMEGKETRFGIAASALFATMTTDTSCGAVNSMHDSFTALGGLVPMVNMQLGEVVFGGVGSGFYGMIVFACSRSSSRA